CEMYRSAISDLKLTIDQQLADGDYVATRYTFRGTHAGDIMGTPATGRDVTVAGLVISRFQNGMVAEEWEVQDTLGMLRQIGALPEVVTS
ncbi:MAG: ester cyclase, partial [Actinomycetota bacterium]|nr:ester cyclase [Actinomycetota bacterium]